MRKAALISLAFLAFVLAACGGGSGSSSSSRAATTSRPATSANGPEASGGPEAAWANEVTAVMSEFENQVSAQLTEQIHTSTSQPRLEPLYANYSANLSVLGNLLESTEAPSACVALRKKMVAYTRQVAALTKTLSHQPQLSPEQYAQKAYKTGLKIDATGHRLGALTAEPSC